MNQYNGITFDDILLKPKKSLSSRYDADLSVQLHEKIRLKIPILSSNMDTITGSVMARVMAKMGGLGVIHRFMSINDQISEIAAVGYHPIGITVGVGDENWKEYTSALVGTGIDLLVVDIANAYADSVAVAIKWIKDTFPEVPVMAGNIATADGAKFLRDAGADIIKVGVGPGSCCTTRVVTGHGVPQAMAIHECAIAVKSDLYTQWNDNSGPTIVADGGIKSSGDIVKAIALGADAVMIGSLLAGTDEAPGEIVCPRWESERKFKIYRGMASKEASRWNGFTTTVAPEGINTFVPVKGPAGDVLAELIMGIKSGCSYQGCQNLLGLRSAEIIRVTHAGYLEGLPSYDPR